MKITLRFMMCGLVVLSLCRRDFAQVSSAQIASAPAPQQFAEFGDFKLRSGEVIHDFRLGYRTMGQLNAAKSNAVLWPTWLGGKSEELLKFAGPGNVVDTDRYFVVFVDAISDGVSTSPSNSKAQPLMKFPRITIGDMVKSEHQLCTEVFHISHLHAVMGVSMGGMQTFEWVAMYPDFMDVAIPIAGSPQSTSVDKLLWTTQINAIEMDPAWNNGNPTGPMDSGIGLSEQIGSLSGTSPSYRVEHTSPEQFDAFLADIRAKAKGDGGTASNQIRQRQAIIALDIPGELGVATLEQAAKTVRAKLLVVVGAQDGVVNPQPAMKFAAAINAPLLKINSSCGHQSFDCVSAGPTVAKFLADPASVHSETLQDPNNH
jgi:homoserine O-acetyltransferase/O-succinyltransferase